MSPQEALAYIEACRDSHIDATAADDPLVTLTEMADAVGDREFHEECVVGYNEVLAALRPLVDPWPSWGGGQQ